jgi:hypothetical protein
VRVSACRVRARADERQDLFGMRGLRERCFYL